MEQVSLQGSYRAVGFSVINSRQLLLANCYMHGSSWSPRQLCSSSVTQPGTQGQAVGIVGLLRCHSREAGEGGRAESQSVGLQEASGKVLCWRCYYRRCYSSSFGLVCSGIVSQVQGDSASTTHNVAAQGNRFIG